MGCYCWGIIMASNFAKLANLEFDDAVAKANAEKQSYSKCQALAWIARFSPNDKVIKCANLAVHAAENTNDHYIATYPLSWPIRALLEREKPKAAQENIHKAIEKSWKITPQASQSEALFLLLQASIYKNNNLWPAVFEAFMIASIPMQHWRQKRNVRDAVLMVAKLDPEKANQAIDRLEDEKLLRIINTKKAVNEFCSPRRFFW